MRTSTFRKIAASFAALAVIVSLGTSPVLARGGGGGGHFGGGGTFIGGGGFMQADLVGAVFIRAEECMAAHTIITASMALTTPVW